MSTQAQEKERLRKYLNSSIRGKNTDIVLEALATGSLHLINNVEAVNDQFYISTAQQQYLDQKLADSSLTRPDNVGLSDDIFRELGIEVVNRKQVRDLVARLLEIFYGFEFTRAIVSSSMFENYALNDGDNLIMQFDDEEEIEITFLTAQFANINNATAQEVADVITKNISRLGRRGSAISKDDGAGAYVSLVSETNGPSSSVRVSGGKAQNVFKFDSIRGTSGDSTTQWTLTQVSGGNIRMTWSGGATPSVGKVKKNDYVNIYGSAFNTLNKGRFIIDKVQGGVLGSAYVEFENPIGVPEVVVQGTAEGVLFFNPVRITLANKLQFAAAYQTEKRLLEIFIPASTKVVRRERIGSAHLHDSGSSGTDYGPYIFDPTKPYTITAGECVTLADVDANTGMIVAVDDASAFPDEEGYLVFGFGYNLEEGPIPYISRPSDGSLMISPSYKFKNIHKTGTVISLVGQNYAYSPAQDGSDYQFFLTDTTSGRVYAQDLIESIVATGIVLSIVVLYSGDIGLGKAGTVNSEKYIIWDI